jgi:hypothetical protein
MAQKDLSDKNVVFGNELPKGMQNEISQANQQNFDRGEFEQTVKEINQARLRGDNALAEKLQTELDAITGNKSIQSDGSENGPKAVFGTVNQEIGGDFDYYFTVINATFGFWAKATSTDIVSHSIYVAASQYNSAGSDTLKLFKSLDGGIHWSYVNWFAYTTNGLHFRDDELDIEAINNGTDAYIYITAGVSSSTVTYSIISRFKSDGSSFFYNNLYNAASGVRIVNSRITSDNAKYPGAYIYNLLIMDSLTATSVHDLKTKFMIITNPFDASPTITYRNFSTVGNYFWYSPAQPDTAVAFCDIAFSDSAGVPTLISVYSLYKGNTNNLYLIYSKDYGAAVPVYNPQIAEANVSMKPRIAFTGLSVPTGIIVNRRLYSGNDWDCYGYKTTNDGANWTASYIDGSSDTTLYTDVTAIYKVPNTFRIGYANAKTQGTTSNIFIVRQNNGYMFPAVQVNPIAASPSFSPIRAGYRLAADSCFAIFSVGSGTGVYVSAGCNAGVVSTGGELTTPVKYTLKQNYPNPFNPVTRISFDIARTGFATLKVYDILGKEVALLVNETKQAGTYTLDFNASNLPSGVYFYKFDINGFTDVKKLILIK